MTLIRSTIVFSVVAVSAWVFTISLSVPGDRQPAKTGEAVVAGLKVCLTAMGELAKRSNPGPYLSRKIWPAEGMTSEQYQALAGKNITTYFEDGVTPEAGEQLKNDLLSVADNFARMHLSSGKLRRVDQVKNELVQIVDYLVSQKDVRSIGDKTLESLFLEYLRNVSSPDLAKGPSWIKWSTQKLVRAPVTIATGALAIVMSQAAWNMKNIMYETTDFVNTPIRTNVSRYTNTNLGWIGVRMQMGLTQIQQSIEIKGKMALEVDKMDAASVKLAAAKKFQIEGASVEEAKKMWLNAEQAFLEYRNELNSILPDNVAVGRSYWNTAMVNIPLTFTTALNTSKSQITAFEDRISNLSHRKKVDSILSEEDEKLLADSYVDLEMAKRQMGTMLSLLKVYQAFYPEHSRPTWTGDPKQKNPYMTGYASIMDGLGIEYYSTQYVQELRQQVTAMGHQLTGENPDALANRKIEIETKLASFNP